MSSWQWDAIEYGCQSSDPFERFHAHQAAKGRSDAPRRPRVLPVLRTQQLQHFEMLDGDDE